jgi:hypothetical protein
LASQKSRFVAPSVRKMSTPASCRKSVELKSFRGFSEVYMAEEYSAPAGVENRSTAPAGVENFLTAPAGVENFSTAPAGVENR